MVVLFDDTWITWELAQLQPNHRLRWMTIPSSRHHLITPSYHQLIRHLLQRGRVFAIPPAPTSQVALEALWDIGVGTMGAVGAMAPPDFTRGGPGPHRCLVNASKCSGHLTKVYRTSPQHFRSDLYPTKPVVQNSGILHEHMYIHEHEHV